MKLGAWMERENVDDRAFAALIEEADQAVSCSAPAVQKWRLGQRIPGPDRMPLITRVTGGEVTANDFYEAPPTSPESGEGEPTEKATAP